MARPALDPQQQRVLQAFLRRANAQGASPKKRKALIEAGLTEAGLHNPNYGDRDSIGSLQERSTYGSAKRRLDPSLAAKRFLAEAQQLDKPQYSAGELAQAVQRSAFPGRYDQHSAEADALMGGPQAAAAKSGSHTVRTSRTIPGVDNSDTRRALILQFLQQRHNPQALVSLASGLQGAQDTPSRKVYSSKTVKGSASSGASRGGVAHFDGKPVAAWIKPLLEYGRAHGWQGTVSSGVRTDAEQKAIYDRGTRPAAVPISEGGAGSNHERTGFLQGAVDVTDAQTLDRILKAKHSRLKFAGARDPVHFSVPRNGTY